MSVQTTVDRDEAAMGVRAAQEVSSAIDAVLQQQQECAVILAAANSQLCFLEALRSGAVAVPWKRVALFQMDEYLDLPANHPAAFRSFLRRHLVDTVRPGAFFELDPSGTGAGVEITRYRWLLQEHPPDICVMGIGDNGHLAFNEPGSDMEEPRDLMVVDLAAESRRQQVLEGHFKAIAETPSRAVTMTIPLLTRPRYLFVIAPGTRKADAVASALEGPIGASCPASVLQTRPDARVFLDEGSAARLRVSDVTAQRGIA